MKHRTLRCAAETLVLLLIAAMAVFLAAGLHQRAPDGALSTLSTGWYQLTDGVRREVTLPAALEAGPGQTITLFVGKAQIFDRLTVRLRRFFGTVLPRAPPRLRRYRPRASARQS